MRSNKKRAQCARFLLLESGELGKQLDRISELLYLRGARLSHTDSTYRVNERFGRFHKRLHSQRTHDQRMNHEQTGHGSTIGSSGQEAIQEARRVAQEFAAAVVNRISGQVDPVRLALITQQDSGLQGIRRQLFDPSLYIVREVLSLQEIQEQLKDFRFGILLMRIPFFSATHVQMLAKVHSAFPHAGMIASCLEIDPMARFQSRNIPSFKILAEPQEVQDLPKIIDKLKRKEVSGLRQHIRNRRDGEADIIDSRGVRLSARFVNFAQMGARLTVRSKELLQKGDRIQLQYRSSLNPNKIHLIEAQITWQQIGGKMMDAIVSGPLQTVGIRFIGML